MIIGAYPPANQIGFPVPEGVVMVDDDPWTGPGRASVGPSVELDVCPDPLEPARHLIDLQRQLIEEGHRNPIAVPLCEEAVLACGWANSHTSTIFPLEMPHGHDRCLGFNEARRAVARAELRRVLEAPGLNPVFWQAVVASPSPALGEQPWQLRGAGFYPVFVKQPASTLSQGVREAHDLSQVLVALTRSFYCDHMRRLERFRIAPTWVVEGYCPPPQYDVNGIIDHRGVVTVTAILLQHWDAHGEKIVRYDRLNEDREPYGLREAAATAVTTLGLACCGFNVEFRRQGPRWVVIDAHARLGEDELTYLAQLDPRHATPVRDLLVRLREVLTTQGVVG